MIATFLQYRGALNGIPNRNGGAIRVGVGGWPRIQQTVNNRTRRRLGLIMSGIAHHRTVGRPINSA